MALESDKRTIGDVTYETTQLPSSVARKTLVRLTRAFGPILGRMLTGTGIKPGASEAEIKAALSLKVVGNLADGLAQNLTEEDLEYLCETFGKVSFYFTPEGNRISLNKAEQELHFSGGNLLAMFRWLAFCIEWNYADFFAAWASIKRPPDKVAAQG